MKTVAPSRACLLIVAACALRLLAAPLGQALAQDPDLTVNDAHGNNPFDSGQVYGSNASVVYNNLIVGQGTGGTYTQDAGDSVNVFGQFIISDDVTNGDINSYTLGGDGTSVQLTANTLVFGDGPSFFSQKANTVATIGTISSTQKGLGEYDLSGGTLNTQQIGTAQTMPLAGFDLDGGILQAAASNAAFMQNLSYAYVEGGARIDSNGFNITIGQALQSGNGGGADAGLTKLGAGTLTLTGANTYTGPTAINAGVLNAGSATALGSGGTITFGGGTLQYSAASAGVDFSSRFSSAGGQAINLDTNGQNATIGYGFGGGNTSLTKLGAGTLTINGANTYAGATSLRAGTVSVNNPQALGNGGQIVFLGGTLQYGDTSHTDAQYNAADYSARFSQTAGQAYSIDTNGHNIAYTSPLTSSGGSLDKLGAGTLTLNGKNSYTGSTNVSAGTLLLNNANTGGGNFLVDGKANPVLGGTGGTVATVFVKNGTLNPGGVSGAAGSAANVGTLSVGGLQLTDASFLALDISRVNNYDHLLSSGEVSLGGSTLSISIDPQATFTPGQVLDLIHLTGNSLGGTFAGIANGGVYTFGGDSFQAVYTGTDFELVAVPEPATWRLLALPAVVVGVGLVRRRPARRSLPAVA